MLTLTALKPCLAAPNRAFAGQCRAYRAAPRLNRDTSRLTGPRKYYYGLLATKFQPTTIWREKGIEWLATPVREQDSFFSFLAPALYEI